MTDFVSDVQKIPYDANRVFTKLSDLNNLEKVQKIFLKGEIKDFTCDSDSCSFKADKVGKIILRVAERDPSKSIKMISEQSPVPFTCWIQLVEVASNDTRLKLTFRADIPFMFKSMISKPLEQGIRKIAEALASLPY
jgi:carbon monoxide dehydrogenase subunit G